MAKSVLYMSMSLDGFITGPDDGTACRSSCPLPVVAEWWRGRTDAREEILASTQIVASLDAAKAAGIPLGRIRNVDAKLTIDAIVMATAALTQAIVVTGDASDFDVLASHFAGVPVLST